MIESRKLFQSMVECSRLDTTNRHKSPHNQIGVEKVLYSAHHKSMKIDKNEKQNMEKIEV
jgi:hypothetical protein